jgi:alanine racemase
MLNIAQARAWVEVDLEALRANFQTVRQRVGPGAAIIAMVKADGYGLGAARVVRALEPLEPWGYGVATAAEGEALRDSGITRPILVLGPLPPLATEQAARAGLLASISDMDALERWIAAARKLGRSLEFHTEVDTGMGRAGFDWRKSAEWGAAVYELAGDDARWTGVFTHFHGADAPERAATAAQWERFQDALAQLPVSREDLMVHVANSAAALRWPELAGDAVRPGIFLYGGNPWAPVVYPELPSPRTVASVRARIVLMREVSPGSTVGYGATHVAKSWERWATLSIGYGDGLPRALGNRGAALLHGKRVPIVGRISMDMTVVDVSAVEEARVGDAVTLMGVDGGMHIDLDDVAQQVGTIGYEILTGLTQRLPRVEC